MSLRVNIRGRAIWRLLYAALLCFFPACFVFSAPLAPAPAVVRYSSDGAVFSARFGLPQIQKNADGLIELSLTNAFPAEQAGLPVLPASVVEVALPDGAQVSACQVTPAETVVVPLDGRVRHGRLAASYSANDPGTPAEPDPVIYALDTPYPALVPAAWSIEQRGRQRVMNVRLTPVQYVPTAGLLLAHRRLDVVVTWSIEPLGAGSVKTDAPAKASAPSQASSVFAVTERFDYVVISSAELLAMPGPYNFQALCAARNWGGFQATNVTTAWIYANYSGLRPDGSSDNATRIRNFIQDAQQNWGTRFVLLGGTTSHVPVRLLHGRVLTGGGYLVESIASDMYYGCLDGTFDSNANGVYGEMDDGEEGHDVDLVAEVYVGRFPVDTTNEVANVVRKTLAYENAAPAALRKISHVGEWLGFGGVSEYATDSMEQLRLGGNYDGYTTVGFGDATNAASFDITDTLYDTSGYTWPNSEIIRRFQQDYHVFNHLGHGNWNYCFRLNTGSFGDRQAILGLTNSSYFLAYSQACQAGRFDDHTDCLAETLVTATNGPAALVMNTRDGWGVGNSTAGPSQYYQRYFWDELLGGTSYLLGEANQKSKEDVRYAVNYYGGAMRWCYYELTLFGDPALPFGARISPIPPTIAFTPLQNQMETQTSYRVTCAFGPVGLYDPDSAQIIWRTSLEPGLVHTTHMSQVAGTNYEAFLPAVPRDEGIYYFIRVASRAGLITETLGSGEYSFYVTSVFDLTVTGNPQPSGDVMPPYGVSQIASGNLVNASATLREVLSDTQARRCIGWQGGGSVPTAGDSNEVSFVMEQTSALAWQWTDEFAMRQHSSPDGVLETNTWYDVGATTATVRATNSASWNGTNYLFAGWYLDSVRVPVTGRVTDQVTNIVMDLPHDALALYLPETQDADLDLVPDWWELYYYGNTNNVAADDTDGDGAGLLTEYLARTDPLDPASFPLPPVITVTPLDSVQTVPPPFFVYVTIEDTSPLVVAQIVWRINQGNLQTGSLEVVASGTNQYVGVLSGDVLSGDEFAYWVQAAGLDGLSAHSATYTTRLEYAVIVLTPPLSRAYLTIPPGVVDDWLTISNHGTATLTWDASVGLGEYADAPLSTNWNLNASGIAWTRSTARSFSASASLRANIVSPYFAEGIGQHAAMTSPPLRLDAHAVLTFNYWINSELDTLRSGYCWDGGIVEVSTNGGLDYVQLSGPYTHAISGWYAAPWDEGTPCFAGAGEGWHEVTFDLSAFAGTTAILRFHYGADDNTDREGWYVDDIRVAPLIPGEILGASLVPATGSLTPGTGANLLVTMDTTPYDRRWLRFPVLFRSNDPSSPFAWYDLVVDRRYPYILAITGTNGVVIGSGSAPALANGTDFGPLLVGAGALTNTFSITNLCDDPLIVSGITTSGVGEASFAILSPPETIAARTSVTFSVVFTPHGGPQDAVMTFAHSGTNPPFALSLTGFGYSGGMQLDTQALAFYGTYGGANPLVQTLALNNRGETAFTFTNAIVYGPGASGWLQCQPSAGTVATNGVCVFTNSVDLTGLHVGTYVATNWISAFDATNSPQAYVVTLTVIGVITNVLPSYGTIYGGMPVTISGLWLGNGNDITNVQLCQVSATIITQGIHWVTVLSGVSPVATNGDVVVESAGFGTVVLGNGYTYQPVPPPPTALSAITITTNRFTARWIAAESATNYLLDVSLSSNFTGFVGLYQNLSLGDVTACLVTGLMDRTTYYYRLRAANSYGSSTNSNVITVPVGANVPYLLYELTNGVVSAGSVDVIDLTRLFHGTNMSYVVMANSHTGLVSTVLSGTNLILWYTAGTTGTVQIIIRVTDSEGFSLDTTVILTIVPAPGLQLGPIVLNRQNGLYEQIAIVSNNSPTRAAQEVTLTVTNLSANYTLYNATGRDLWGNPEIHWVGTMLPLTSLQFTLQYYTATRGVAPSATVLASLSLVAPAQDVPGTVFAIGSFRPTVGNTNYFLVEFSATPGQLYYIQYTDSLMNPWKTVYPGIEAPVNRVQWIDAGPPGTDCMPGTVPTRFYRVIEAGL